MTSLQSLVFVVCLSLFNSLIDQWTTMDTHQIQLVLETLYHKNQLIPRLLEEAAKAPIDIGDLKDSFCRNLLVQMVLHKKALPSTIIGLLRKHYDTAQEVSDALEKAIELRIVNYDYESGMLHMKYNITQEVQDELDKYQFPIPMLVEPKEVTKNNQTGYLKVPHGSLILKDNYHEDDICLDHINRMNKIELSINKNVTYLIQNKWKNLDKPKPDETIQDYQKRVRAFIKYTRASKEIIALLLEHSGNGKGIHLTHAYDKRGRVYCRG